MREGSKESGVFRVFRSYLVPTKLIWFAMSAAWIYWVNLQSTGIILIKLKIHGLN